LEKGKVFKYNIYVKVNHISIAVKDFEKGLEIFKKIFKKEPEIKFFEEGKLKIGIFYLENIMIEIISPLEGEENVSKFLEKRGDGIHHIALEVDNIDEKIEEIEKEGFKIATGPRKGVKSKKVIFLHPNTTNKVLIEFVEK